MSADINIGTGATIRLTMAQALVRYLAALRVDTGMGAAPLPLFGGVFAIFGHGNVAGIGEALQRQAGDPDYPLPTYRAHNEQAMAHAAIAYAKANDRRRMMAVTTSIGPGATNLLTAAALAHVNRLPVLLLPGDVFVSRAPDPVLQQLEHEADGAISVNDAFKPLSRYFDRIVHPAQLLTALPRAIQVLTDAAACGPVTLALPQDVQAMAYDYPLAFFTPRLVRFHPLPPRDGELDEAAALLRAARKPLIVAGGGVLYGRAGAALRAFAERHGVPVAETQAGKSALPWDHALQLGGIGVSGSPAANTLAAQADLVLAVGTRLQDFTSGSNALFAGAAMVNLNVNAFDALKGRAVAVRADAQLGLDALSARLDGWSADGAWQNKAALAAANWRRAVTALTAPNTNPLPGCADVIGAVQRSGGRAGDTADDDNDNAGLRDIVVCAAGTLPAELHKLWRSGAPGGYHVEYGYSCMGYEIAGGLGVKMARPDAEVIVMVGDGSYLMMNSEIATSVMLGKKLLIVVLDNRGYACIDRLQRACGGASFNNMLADCLQGADGAPRIDFAMHARSLGATGEHVRTIAELEQALARARAAPATCVICIDTDPAQVTADGGCWWEVAVPEVSERAQVRAAHARYQEQKQRQGN